MDVLATFLQTLRKEPSGNTAPPLVPPAEMGPLVTRMWQLVQDAQLPHLSEEEVRQLAQLLDPELRAIANDCITLLRRRPALAADGLTADWLHGLVLLGLELETLGVVADDILGSAGAAVAAFRAALGAWNARVLLFVQERVADVTQPLLGRQQLLYRFQAPLAEEERLGQRTPRPDGNKKITGLKARIEAAQSSQAVLGAVRMLRGLLGEERAR